jgi:hypothetical protein
MAIPRNPSTVGMYVKEQWLEDAREYGLWDCNSCISHPLSKLVKWTRTEQRMEHDDDRRMLA